MGIITVYIKKIEYKEGYSNKGIDYFTFSPYHKQAKDIKIYTINFDK